jgi:MFS family permease
MPEEKPEEKPPEKPAPANPQSKSKQPRGFAAFTVVWAGQLVSVLGTRMTGFALMIWIWQQTGQATALALLAFFTFAPILIMLPIAGSLVDRLNRKLAIILSDLAAGIGTVVILVLFMADALQIWHLYVIAIFSGAFGAFQWPAFSAAITTMVEKKHYGRASGMVGMVESVSGIFGPPLAAVFLVMIGISGILVIDIITFIFAIGVVLLVHIPQPPPADDLEKGAKGVLKGAGYGFKYIYRRKPLFGLQMTFFAFNVISTLGMVVIAPMLLARTNSDNMLLGLVQMVISVGGLIGGIALAIWGGPKKKIHGLLGGMMLIGVLFAVGFGIGRTPIIWMIFGFTTMLFVPILNGSSQAIWQSKVPANKQGRVFAARAVIAQGASAISMLVAGPLADKIFEPAMAAGGSMAGKFGWLVGTGPGAGMALMIFVSSMITAFVALIGYSVREIREVETLIPDAENQIDSNEKTVAEAAQKKEILQKN